MRTDPTLALVLDAALDSVIVMDRHGHVAEWNSEAEKAFGWTRQEAMGAEMAAMIIPEKYRESHRAGLARYFATGEGPVLRKRIEITALNKEGIEFPVELSIFPTDRNGETIFIGFIRDIKQRVESERLQSLLLAELEHRTKNMLTVVMGIASQTARAAPSVEAFTKDYLSRLASLSSTYSLLTKKNWQSATLSSLLTEVVKPHLSSPDQLRFEGNDVTFPAKAALSIGMVLHELTTNAVKYGALQHHGRITLTSTGATESDRTVVILTWRESGAAISGAPERRGFGSKLIDTTIKHELAGAVDIHYHDDGIEYVLKFST
jgi:PAS domain S-box-containing protein